MSRPRIIAFYLPQFYPTPINDKWYGEGFTEWTTVRNAKPLFRGHDQPRVPADLGYYDLRDASVREAQAELAREAGIEGFCYYHYWFSKDHQELTIPFDEVLRLKKPDFPFCLCWANQSWYSKFWDKTRECEPKLVAEQIYDDPAGNEQHFYSLLEAFRDPRYIRVEGRTLFMIYRPVEFPGVREFMAQWQALAEKNGLPPFYFIGQGGKKTAAEEVLELGLDGANIVHKFDVKKHPVLRQVKHYCKFRHIPFHVDYEKVMHDFFDPEAPEALSPKYYPALIPNWDHSPRSGWRGSVYTNSTPETFRKHAEKVIYSCRGKDHEHNLIFLKSWNEWGEGNYMEPDTRYGKGFIRVLREILDGMEED